MGILTPLSGSWSSTLSLRVRLVISRLDLIFALPLDFYGRVRVVRAMFLPCALHGVEASYLSKGSFLKLRAAVMRAVWSRKHLLVLVLYLAFWMCHMVVILLFVLSGSGFVCFVGICLLGLMRILGCTGFWILFMMAVPVMVLFML